jgi:hypothetical protein
MGQAELLVADLEAVPPRVDRLLRTGTPCLPKDLVTVDLSMEHTWNVYCKHIWNKHGTQYDNNYICILNV